jgi:hypothetical protein
VYFFGSQGHTVKSINKGDRGSWTKYKAHLAMFLAIEYFCSIYISALMFEPRASHLVGNFSTTWPCPPSFCFSYFWNTVSCFWPVVWNVILHTSRMIVVPHHIRFFYWLRWGVTNFFPNSLVTKILMISTSLVAGIIGVSH